MTTWLPRGLVFAAGMVLLRLVQGTLINTYPSRSGLISLLLVVVFGIAALLWGLLDGTADARANDDPDRRRDLAMRWLLAGLAAGVLSGAVVWIISLVVPNIYAEGLVGEVTTIAAFTALLVFLPAMLAVTVGRWLVDRNRPPQERRRETDVFESVQDESARDADRTGPIPPVPATAATGAIQDYPEERVSAVALAERVDATENLENMGSTGYLESETEQFIVTEDPDTRS